MPLKYLSDFWRTLVMSLINCKISLFLPCTANCVITNSTDAGIFATTNTKLYVPVVTLSTRDNTKLQSNLNQDAHVQLTGININQKYQGRHKIYVYFILSKFPRSE